MHVKAGTHRVSAAFIQRFEGLINDLIAPIDHTMADTEIGIGLRHYDAAAPAQPQHRRTASRHRRERYAEPARRVLVPPAVAS